MTISHEKICSKNIPAHSQQYMRDDTVATLEGPLVRDPGQNSEVRSDR